MTAQTEADVTRYEADYLGVDRYGSEDVNKDTKEDFVYRFFSDGKEMLLRIDPGKEPDQVFKEGVWRYRIAPHGNAL